MNCKPGDLAVHIYGQHVGAIVQVIRPWRFAHVEHLPFRWETTPLPDGSTLVMDSMLRPIRDNDGEDQTLTWAGKPSDIKTPEAA